MQQLFDLTGNTAIVTGCNTGLGQGMALALSLRGVARRLP
jgi:2-dehydro-3-deoxy-D-gluconate 5-dehydrogenase